MDKKNSNQAEASKQFAEEPEEEKKGSPPKAKSTKAPKNVIFFYRERDAYGFLSNFWPSPVTLGGMSWPTTVHYFQAMKFPTLPEYQEKIRNNKSPASSKRSGKNSNGFR